MYLKIMTPDSKHIFTGYGAISRHQREADRNSWCRGVKLTY